MAEILVATDSGCRVFTESGERAIELAGRKVSALAPKIGGSCLAVVDGQEIWRRAAGGTWSKAAIAKIPLQSIASFDGTIFGGGSDEAVMLRIPRNGEAERLVGFDNVAGRGEWFAGGPPLGVRSLATTADGGVILAGVHVGGIPRSSDEGESWAPTIPVMFDVHEVRAHSSLPNIVAAATAMGLCVSDDAGLNWRVLAEGLELTYSLAVAVLEGEVLFAISDGPFAQRSQVFRWRIGGGRVEGAGSLEQVRDGLPEWLDGKVDTANIAAGGGRAAIVEGAGNLWLSKDGSRGWERLATGLPYAWGLLIL